MIHYIGDVSFFYSFFKEKAFPFEKLFLFVKDIAELKVRLNQETYYNATVFYVGDVADVVEEVVFHSGFVKGLNYLFVHFMSEDKRNEIKNILSPNYNYYYRYKYLCSLYKEIIEADNEDFFVYSPRKIILNAKGDFVLKDLSYFPFFTRKSVLKDENALIEKITVQIKDDMNLFIADNKENFIIQNS